MRLPLALIYGALLGAAQANVAIRQDSVAATGVATSAPALIPTPSSSADSGSGSGSGAGSDSSTAPPPDNGGGSTSTTAPPSGGGGGDTTVTSTETVTGSGSAGSTVTDQTTVVASGVTTVTATSTVFATTTVTSSDQETATKVIYVTTTMIINSKRDVDANLPARAVPAQVDALPTPAPHVQGYLEKRDTVTEVVTVTVAGKGSSDITVTDTVTKSVLSTKKFVTTLTNFVTETEQANAKTTITTTSTLTVTSTGVSTGVGSTVISTSSPTGAAGGHTGSKSSSSGLSTGAKAGIGVGAGVGGLAIIAALAWILVRSRNRGPRLDHDDLVGASEVPVGPSGGGRRPPPAAAGFNNTSGDSAKPYREGYRGTAMGDGRAGFAKPAYGGNNQNNTSLSPNSYTPGSNFSHSPTTTMTGYDRPNMAEIGPGLHAEPTPAAELGPNDAAGRWHDINASEIDGHQVTSHHDGPVYEMPAQDYR